MTVSSQLTCGHLRDLAAGYEADRPVWIDTGGGPRPAVYGSQIDPVSGEAATLLRSWGLGPAPTEPVFVLEWAGPAGSTLPATMTAYRSEAGVRAAIGAAAAELGVEPVEDARPGPMRMVMVGELIAMVRSMELLP